MEEKINPHEFLKRLRKGEQLKCPECKKGIVKPVGDCKTTRGFNCTECKFKINID